MSSQRPAAAVGVDEVVGERFLVVPLVDAADSNVGALFPIREEGLTLQAPIDHQVQAGRWIATQGEGRVPRVEQPPLCARLRSVSHRRRDRGVPESAARGARKNVTLLMS